MGFIALILLVFAFVLLILAGLRADEPLRGRLVCFGLASAIAAALVAFGPVLTKAH